MKRLVVVDQSACVACLACELACAEAFYKVLDTELSCIQITKNDTGDLETLVCTQCGKCAEVCDVGAIKQNKKGVYTINKKLCVDCGKCIDACPFGIIVKSEEKDAPTKCIACGKCVAACPQGVLEIQDV